jgi:hypothetical protein
MPEMHIHTNSTTYGSSARNQLARADGPGLDGARAALETFYHAFNHSDLDTLAAVWHDDQLVQLNNPLGGMLRGREAIRELYARVFDGAGQAQITFSDIVEYATEDVVIFTGRERGTFHHAKNAVPSRSAPLGSSGVAPIDGGWCTTTARSTTPPPCPTTRPL